MPLHTVGQGDGERQACGTAALSGRPENTFRKSAKETVRRIAKFLFVELRAKCIVSNMAKHDPNLDLLFHALSDPTRRMMLARLAEGAAAVSELAGPTGLRLPTILRHLSVLEEAGLIATQKDGRVRSCALQPQALAPMRDWLEEQRRVWEARLDRLDDYVMKLMKEREK